MPDALSLGPLVLPWSLPLLALAAGCALVVGRRLGDGGAAAPAEVERVLWRGLVVALVAARLGHVWQYGASYWAAPLSILDLRDGGWSQTAGLAGAWLYGLARMTRLPALKRPLRWALAAGSAVWLAGSVAIAVATASGAGQRMPSLELAALDGSRVRLDGASGQPVVVNLWATWCAPCVREMPVLEAAQREHRDVRFVFVNQGEPPERVRAWLSQRGLRLDNVLVDPRGEAGAAFEHVGLPTTLFFDAEGRLVSRRVGELSAATLAERLRVARGG